MKFFPPSSNPVHIALTSGHTARVMPEGTELAPIFRREAIAMGCSTDVSPAVEVEGAIPQFNRADAIRAAINAMLDGKDEDDFTNDGRPDLRKLNKRVGFTVARDEADKLFAEVAEKAE